jgi:hypothetical protein
MMIFESKTAGRCISCIERLKMTSINMKKLFATFFAAALLFAIGAGSLHAQDAVSTNNDTSAAVASAADTNAQSNSNAASATGITYHKSPGDETYRSSSGALYGRNRPSRYGGDNMDFGRTLVNLAGILSPFIFTFSITVVILVIIFYSRHRQNKLMHETIRAMLDKGMPVTPEVIAGLKGKQSYGEDLSGVNSSGQMFPRRQRMRNRHLLPALILIGVGLAMTGLHPWHAGTGGKIVLFIGVAFFIVWFVERKQNGNYDNSVNVERKQNDQQPPKI